MTTDTVRALLNKQQTLQINEPYRSWLDEYVSEQWYQNLLKATKNKSIVFNTLNDCAKVDEPKLIIIGSIFYSMSMKCVALASFVQEICDEFELTTDISSADVKKLYNERVVMMDTTTYKLDGDNIASDWKELITHIVVKIINANRNVVVLSLGSGNNAITRELIENGYIEPSNAIMVGHPSPKATTSNFRGSNCFRDVNKRLVANGFLPVRFGIIFS